jgi:hypothetical protein
MNTKPMFPFIQGVAIFAIFWIALFLPASTINWGFGWLFWGSFFVFFHGNNGLADRKQSGISARAD